MNFANPTLHFPLFSSLSVHTRLPIQAAGRKSWIYFPTALETEFCSCGPCPHFHWPGTVASSSRRSGLHYSEGCEYLITTSEDRPCAKPPKPPTKQGSVLLQAPSWRCLRGCHQRHFHTPDLGSRSARFHPERQGQPLGILSNCLSANTV